jgi:hypothetical protein
MTYKEEITSEAKKWLESTKEVDAVNLMISFADYWHGKQVKDQKLTSKKGCEGCDCKDGICFNY